MVDIRVMSAASQMTQIGTDDNTRTDTFFDLDWWTSNNTGSISSKRTAYDTDYNSGLYVSPTLTEAFHYAKILYSLLLLDLGNRQLPSLLLKEDDLGNMSPRPNGEDRYDQIPRPGGNGTDKGLVDLKVRYDLFEDLAVPNQVTEFCLPNAQLVCARNSHLIMSEKMLDSMSTEQNPAFQLAAK
ncbi:hypothetical protein LX36DRAFT_665612 [Colletotrichum falcatum]|nr:hypothetical protein LX36DRAFT_665612 [Colletotrichum falcatum]